MCFLFYHSDCTDCQLYPFRGSACHDYDPILTYEHPRLCSLLYSLDHRAALADQSWHSCCRYPEHLTSWDFAKVSILNSQHRVSSPVKRDNPCGYHIAYCKVLSHVVPRWRKIPPKYILGRQVGRKARVDVYLPR